MSKKTRDPETQKLIDRLQREEDKSLADRRRQMQTSVEIALPLLDPDEMTAIEPILWGAIGRAACRRRQR